MPAKVDKIAKEVEAELIFADAIHHAIRDAFEFDAEIAFRAYLAGRPATKWVVSADFVLAGAERANDTFAFTVHPYEQDDFGSLLAQNRHGIPADIKRVKRLHGKTAAFLHDQSRFHFCFLPNRNRHELGSWQDAQDGIADLLRHVRQMQAEPAKRPFVRKVEALAQRAKARKFNYALLHDIVLLASLAAWIAVLIARHSRPEVIMWAFDRDAMTTAFDGIVSEMTFSNFHALCRLEKVHGNRVTLGFISDPDATDGDDAWFDDLVRAPDYIAGTMARWDFHLKEPQSLPGKIADVIELAIGENPNIVIILITCSLFGITTARARAYNTQNANRTAYRHTSKDVVNYVSWVCLHQVRTKQPRYRTSVLGGTAINGIGLVIWWRPIGHV